MEIPFSNSSIKPLILSGPSGAGKGTLVKMLLEKYPALFKLSVSLTTRDPRPNERHGIEYYFVKDEEFRSEITKNAFVEHCDVHGKCYGTHKEKLLEIIQQGMIPLLDVDVQGGIKIHSQYPDWHYVFLNTKNIEDLEVRLKRRGTETEE